MANDYINYDTIGTEYEKYMMGPHKGQPIWEEQPYAWRVAYEAFFAAHPELKPPLLGGQE